MLIGAVAIQNPAAKPARFRMTICKLNPFVQRPVVNQRVGIQDENQFPMTGLDPHIVRLAEPEVRAIFKHTNLGKILAD